MLNSNDITAGSSDLYIEGGIMLTEFRGTRSVSDVTFVSSGDSFIVTSGKSASQCTVLDDGEMRIESGAMASGIVVSSGALLWVEPGCDVSGLTIKSGARVNGFRLSKDYAPADFTSKSSKGLVLGKVYVDSGIDAVLGSGQGVDECSVLAGGSIDFQSGAFAEMSLMVSSGGKINGFTATGLRHFYANVGDGDGVQPLDELQGFKVYESGRIRKLLEIESGSIAYLYSGQSLLNCIVPDGGRLEVADGGLIEGIFNLTGSLVLADGALVNDLTVNVIMDSLEQANAEPFMMTGDKTPESFSVTIDRYQMVGVYLLANGLSDDYNCSVKFMAADGAELATLTLESENAFEYEYGTYGLSMTEGTLALTVSQDYPESYPVLTVSMQNDGRLLVNGSDEIALRRVKYRFDDEGEWQYLVGDSLVVPEGASIANLLCINCAGQEKTIPFGVNDALPDDDNRVSPFSIAFGPNDKALEVTAACPDGTQGRFSTEDGRISFYVRQDGISISAADAEGNGYLGDGIALPNVEVGELPMYYAAGTDDGVMDVFIAVAAEKWEGNYVAYHAGFRQEDETVVGALNVMATIKGCNRIHDIFTGAKDDSCVLLLTDDENGDAIFVDDVFSNSPDGVGETQARVANISLILAGAGDDVIDLTSSQFTYIGSGVTIHGGDGDDVIWSNLGSNCLLGDDGNDWIVGGCDDDVIVGGQGDDDLNGNGGEDIFCFAPGWGEDTVRQSVGGKAILWFADGLDVVQDGRSFSCNDDEVTLCNGVDFEVRVGNGPDGMYAQRYAYLCSLGAYG